MEQVTDFVKDIIDSIDFTYDIVSFSDNGTDTTIIVTKTFHTRFNSTVNDTIADFSVLSVDEDTKTIVISGLIDTSKPITIDTPHYFFGTVLDIDAELDLIRETGDKVPLIYLYEVLSETVNNEPDSIFQSEPSVNMFFLDIYDKRNHIKTVDHYKAVIIPQRNLIEEFIQALNDNGRVGLFDTYKVINRVKFSDNRVFSGREDSLTGEQDSTVFNMSLSGCQLQITFPILINLNCD